MKQQQSFFCFSLFLVFFLCTRTLAQPAAAPSQGPVTAAVAPPPTITQPPAASPQTPAPPNPTNVTKILEKDGHFSIFIRLLKATQEENHLLSVLNNSNNGLTIFAPSDTAFSNLKSGTLNSLSETAKAELVKFHELPTFLTASQFQTLTNPVGTEAGTGGRLSLNVTTYPNSVNISTGLTNTSISGTVYTDNQLAIYRVDKVLLPLDIFTAKPPSPAPAPPPVKEPKKKAPTVQNTPVVSVDTSDVVSLMHKQAVFLAVGMAAAVLLL